MTNITGFSRGFDIVTFACSLFRSNCGVPIPWSTEDTNVLMMLSSVSMIAVAVVGSTVWLVVVMDLRAVVKLRMMIRVMIVDMVINVVVIFTPHTVHGCFGDRNEGGIDIIIRNDVLATPTQVVGLIVIGDVGVLDLIAEMTLKLTVDVITDVEILSLLSKPGFLYQEK